MRPLLASLAVCLLLTHAAHAQTVGMLGDWQKIEFEGLEQVDADEIRHALSLDLEYQAAARPSASLEEFLKTTEKRIKEGFRLSGYVKAKVDVGHDAKRDRIVALVEEGAKYTAGEIRVKGINQVDSDKIAQIVLSVPRERYWNYGFRDKNSGRLTEAERKNALPTLVPGSPMRMDEISGLQFSRQLYIAVYDAGFATSTYSFDFDLDESAKQVHWTIEFTKERPRAKIGKVLIRGLTRHTEQEVLDYLQFHPGDSFDVDKLDLVYQRIRDSCRFWNYGMTVGLVASDVPGEEEYGTIQVWIDVVEYPHVPKLDENLSEVDEALRKAAHWLENYGGDKSTSTDDMIVEFNDQSRLSQGRVCYSPTNGWIATAIGQISESYSLDHAIVLGTDEMAAYSWLQQRKLLLPGRCVVPTLTASPSPFDGESYKPSCQFGFGFNTDTDRQHLISRMNISIEPVAFVEYSHRTGIQSSISNGQVRLWDKNASLVVEADTGRIIEIAAKSEESQSSESTRIYFKPRAFEEEIERIHERANSFVQENAPNKSLLAVLRFALADALEQPAVKRNSALASLLLDADKIVDSKEAKSYLNQLETKLTQDSTTNTARFTIPLSERIQKDTTAEWGGYLLALADLTFPRGTWPWTISREVAMSIMVGDDGLEVDEHFSNELWKTITEQAPGPLFSVLVASYGIKSSPEVARMAIVDGMTRLDDDAFLKDIAPLIDGELGFARVSEVLVQHLHQLDEQERKLLLAIAPEQLHLPLENLFARRKSQPDENPREALRIVLLECFREIWREQMRGEFAFLASEPDDLAAEEPLGPYPSTGIGPNDPWQITPTAVPTDRFHSTGLPKSLADPATASELWKELK